MITMSSTDIIPTDEQVVKSTIEKAILKSENLLISSEALRRRLVKHLISEKQPTQAHYVNECGTFLMFKQYMNEEKTATLHKANFCKHPMCPLCAWRRHLKYSRIIDKAIELSNSAYLYHLVLAIPNVNDLQRADLSYLKERGKTFLQQKLNANGYFSNLEIVEKGRGLHPHLHILFSSEMFIRVNAEFIKLMSNKWLRHYIHKLPQEQRQYYMSKYDGFTFYLTGFDKRNRENICFELTKYIVKGDIMCDGGALLPTVARAIKGIRKISAGGDLKKNMSEAKKVIADESDTVLDNLSRYEWEYRIYEFINGKYERKNEKND